MNISYCWYKSSSDTAVNAVIKYVAYLFFFSMAVNVDIELYLYAIQKIFLELRLNTENRH